MKNKEIYLVSKEGRLIKATPLMLFKSRIKRWFKKWKLIDSSKYVLIPRSDMGKWFGLSEEEYKESERLYKEEKRTISYEFYPCGGIGWGVRVHDLKTKETFDITDVTNW